MWCGAERYGAVWDEHKERTGESGMDKASCGITDKDRSLVARVKNDCGSARHTTTTVKCKRQIKKKKKARMKHEVENLEKQHH